MGIPVKSILSPILDKIRLSNIFPASGGYEMKTHGSFKLYFPEWW
jgi:hypothetical protein